MTGNTDDTADGTAMDDERRLSRRAVLGTIGAGALAGTAATIPGAAQSSGTQTTNGTTNGTATDGTATATPTGSPPPAPIGVSADRPTMEADIKVTWGEPVDPCATDLDHYEVLLDGSVQVTVPVGGSYARLYRSDAVTVGVRSVDVDGRRSATKTVGVSPSSYSADPYATVSPDAPGQAVATGVRVAIPLVASPALGSPLEVLGETYELSISTPCVARIRAASSGTSATVNADGTAATIETSERSPRPDIDGGPLTIGCIVIETLAPGDTGIRMDATTGFAYPSTLAVADDGAVPAETSGLSSSCPGSFVPTATPESGSLRWDVDGSGEVNYQDVVDYFRWMDSSIWTNNKQYFDYTGNGEIDYQDLVTLYKSIPA